jgi:hypothetical protein
MRFPALGEPLFAKGAEEAEGTAPIFNAILQPVRSLPVITLNQ